MCVSTPPVAPVNDNCSGAIALTASGDFATGAIVGTVSGATTVTGLTYACQTNRAEDVWYSVVVPASGRLTIETKAQTGSTMTDSVLSVFSGTCSSLTEIACDDDTGDGNFSMLTVTNQTPVQHYILEFGDMELLLQIQVNLELLLMTHL
ncbi:hypothetical protein H9W95_11040 [Flavobacterium lindanitolerans]|nr:hypothetical protein [Flavobacterium lindanitolerans]